MQLSSFKYLFIICSLVSSCAVFAEPSSDTTNNSISFSYWNEAAPPFVFEEDELLSGGMLKDFGDAIAHRLKRTPHYLKLPVPRIEQYLSEGRVGIDCITNRSWKKSPDNYNWSPTLFDGEDRLLVRKDAGYEINEFKDLEGKLLGVYNGYIYHPTIMNMIENGKVKTVKVNSVEKGILLLKLQRLDALIDFGIILRYQLKTADEKGELRLANLIADEYELSCAYSKKLSIPKAEIDTAISELIDKGLVSKILRKYR